jgi:hypothetical protein
MYVNIAFTNILVNISRFFFGYANRKNIRVWISSVLLCVFPLCCDVVKGFSTTKVHKGLHKASQRSYKKLLFFDQLIIQEYIHFPLSVLWLVYQD